MSSRRICGGCAGSCWRKTEDAARGDRPRRRGGAPPLAGHAGAGAARGAREARGPAAGGQSIGGTIGEFRKEVRDVEEDVRDERRPKASSYPRLLHRAMAVDRSM